MSNAPDVSDPNAVGSLWDSQIQNPDNGTPSDGNPGNDPQGTTPASTVQDPAPGTGTDGNANPQGQQPGNQPTEDPRDIQIRRLNGQIATMQKQFNKMQRSQQPANPNNAPNGQDPNGQPSVYTPEQFTFALNAVEGQVRRGLESRLSLYDGSNPAYKEQGNLTPDEVMLVRSNPLAFCTMETVMSGDIDAVLDEIETRLAQLTSTRAASGKSGTPVNTPPAGQQPPGMQVNPSPAQTPDTTQNPQNGQQDYWSMPLDQLKKIVANNRQATQQTR